MIDDLREAAQLQQHGAREPLRPVTPSEAYYRAKAATQARREAEEREAEAWDTYHAIRGESLPPDWPQGESSW